MTHTAPMRLVAVSIVKNEADIIEAFVRHTLAWVDHHLIFDHDSTDGTRQILGALRREGLPVGLFTDDHLGNLQQARSNHLTRVAVRDHAADWILPLDADEILAGPDRTALGKSLAATPPHGPASLPLLNYYPTDGDNSLEANPVLRLRHCQTAPPVTQKIMIPRHLASDPDVSAGKGSHGLYRGSEPLPATPLSEEFHLCHLALRSPQHQVLRVVLAELQKLSRGRAHAGLDVHYRLGFQLLAENPELFFATVFSNAASLRLKPIDYRGGPLKFGASSQDWNRVARALLPFLEKLAASHGDLLDRIESGSAAPDNAQPPIRELSAGEIPVVPEAGGAAGFRGFTAVSGWGPREGPVPEAFLPPFHWSYAPVTRLAIHSNQARPARLLAEALTYSEGQRIRVELNGATVAEQAFPRTNQKERIHAPLSLIAGENRLEFHYTQQLVAPHDPRKLAALFLSLQIADAAAS